MPVRFGRNLPVHASPRIFMIVGLAIMGLYIVAILLLTSGIVDREERTLAAGPRFDPTIRTDCWPRLPARPH